MRLEYNKKLLKEAKEKLTMEDYKELLVLMVLSGHVNDDILNEIKAL